ncbi:MAG: PLP-dependent cysteine synthase family protein [Polaromonas sp.]
MTRIAMQIPARFRRYYEQAPLLALIGGTPLVELPLFRAELPDCRFYAKLESTNPGGSIKDRPVRRMLLEALANGELTPARTVLDSSSGNAGIAYAMLGAALGLQVELVVPGNASQERKRRIRAHGAHLVETDPSEGYDAALHEAHRRHDADPTRYFMPDQYRNPANWQAHYEETAVELLAQTGGKVSHFIAGVGTGGTITGVGRRLKETIKGVRVIMACPEVFPGIEGLKPLDAPNAIVPAIFDTSVVDERIAVRTEEAYALCNRLARELGLFFGQSSGAFLKAAYDVARRERRGTFVTVFSDLGERYFSVGLWD